jgi:hypothetical protein
MTKSILGFIIVFSLVSNLNASEKFVTGGINASQFYDAISKPLPGYSLGFGWEWKKGASLAFIFSPSFLYRGVKLENKTVWDQNETMYKEDIWCRIGYLDLPFCMRRYLGGRSFFLSAGLSPALGVYDGSDQKILSKEVFPTGHYPAPHDFNVNIDNYPPIGATLDIFLGGGHRTDQLSLEGLLRLSWGEAGTVKGINIGSQFISFSILGSYYF